MKKIFKRLAIAALVILSFVLFYKVNFEVPILMYHHVGLPEDRSSTNVSLETFENQMEFLKVHRYRVVPLEELVETIKSGKSIPADTVAITFDDGYLDNIQNAFPVLKKMNFPATIFVITRNINEPGWLSEEDLKILDESGISIGAHSVNHAFLKDSPTGDAALEISESKKRLEKILGHPVTLFSYPAGGLNRETPILVEKAGYEGAVTTNYGKTKHSPYALHRIKASEGHGNLFGFWMKVSGLYHFGKKRVEIE